MKAFVLRFLVCFVAVIALVAIGIAVFLIIPFALMLYFDSPYVAGVYFSIVIAVCMACYLEPKP